MKLYISMLELWNIFPRKDFVENKVKNRRIILEILKMEVYIRLFKINEKF